MQGYARARDEAFALSRECFAGLEEWAASEESAGLQHADLEEQFEVRGRELVRLMFQGHLDLLAGGEERRGDVAGEDGVVRTRAERGRSRPLVTKFGQVSVSRIAYRSPRLANVHPLDGVLNLPQEKHSHGLRRLAAVEAARGSMDAAGAAVTRATGVEIGKRQVEGLALRGAADVEAFYASRLPGPAPDDHALVLTFDGKGIVMRPDALRPATAKAAASAENRLATRLSPGEKNGRKRMAELACVYDAAPLPRAPRRSSAPPRRNGGRRKRRPAHRRPGRSRASRRPAASG